MSEFLPCESCTIHTRNYLEQHPITGDPFEWSVAFHNDVNRRLEKKQVSLENARELYKDSSKESFARAMLGIKILKQDFVQRPRHNKTWLHLLDKHVSTWTSSIAIRLQPIQSQK
jgi:hypothetical protein